MLLSTLLVAVITSLAHAQYAYICPVNWPVVAYVLGSQSNVATTYLVACGAGIVQTAGWQYQCDFVQPYTLIQGPSTMAFNYTGLGGFGSATVSEACDLTSTTYVECTVSGGGRNTSGVSTNVAQVLTAATVIWTGSQAENLFSNVRLVQDTSLLLTYIPAGATVTGLTSVTANFAASSTTYKSSSSLVIASATGTPSSTTGARQGGAQQVGMDLRRIFASATAVLILVTIL